MKNNVCPNCGSYKTVKMGRFSRFFMIMAAAGVSSIFWIIFPPLILGTLFLLIVAPMSFFVPGEWECKGCGFKWEVKKKKKEKKQKAEQKKEYSRLF